MGVQVNRSGTTTEALMALTGAAAFNKRLVAVPDESALRVCLSSGPRRVELVAVHTDLPGDCGSWIDAFAVTVSDNL